MNFKTVIIICFIFVFGELFYVIYGTLVIIIFYLVGVAVSKDLKHSTNNQTTTTETHFSVFNPLGDILAVVVDLLQSSRHGLSDLLKDLLIVLKDLLDKLVIFLEDTLKSLGISLDGFDDKIKCILINPLKLFGCLKDEK